MSPEFELTDYFTGPKHRGNGATSGIDAADADFIDATLSGWRLSLPIRVNRRRLHESHEAWIHVEISGDESESPNLVPFAHFGPYPRAGILTWCNSD